MENPQRNAENPRSKRIRALFRFADPFRVDPNPALEGDPTYYNDYTF